MKEDINVKIKKLENGTYSATITKNGNEKDGIIKNRSTLLDLILEIKKTLEAYYVY